MSYILLIEDNQDNADLIMRTLASLNHPIRHTLRGLEGSRMAAQERPALILLDFNLPDVDGRNLILTLKRSLGGNNAPPIIAVTARANHVEQILAQRFGVDAFISKPFEPQMLLDTVTRFLSKAANSPAKEAKPKSESTAQPVPIKQPAD